MSFGTGDGQPRASRGGPGFSGARWFDMSDYIHTPANYLAEQIKQATRLRTQTITQPYLDAQRAQMNTMIESALQTERIRTEALISPMIEAERVRRLATIEPLQQQVRIHFDQLWTQALAPLQSAASFSGPDFGRVFDQLAAASKVSFESIGVLGDTLDVEDWTVDELLASDELLTAVDDFIQSEPVSDLLDQLDLEGVTEEEAERARTAAAESIVGTATPGGLSTGQAFAYCTALYLLVTASVLSYYGYNEFVGQVADVVAWPLAVLALMGLAQRRD